MANELQKQLDDYNRSRQAHSNKQHQHILSSLDMIGEIHAHMSVIKKEMHKLEEVTASYMKSLQVKE